MANGANVYGFGQSRAMKAVPSQPVFGVVVVVVGVVVVGSGVVVVVGACVVL